VLSIISGVKEPRGRGSRDEHDESAVVRTIGGAERFGCTERHTFSYGHIERAAWGDAAR